MASAGRVAHAERRDDDDRRRFAAAARRRFVVSQSQYVFGARSLLSTRQTRRVGKRRRDETSTPIATKADAPPSTPAAAALASFDGDGRASSVPAYRAMLDAWRTSEANVVKQVFTRKDVDFVCVFDACCAMLDR